MSSVTLTRSLLFSNPFTGSLVFNVSNSKLAYSLFPCLPQFASSNENHLIYLCSFPFILCMSYILFAFLLASSLRCLPTATILLTVRATHPQSLEIPLVYIVLSFSFSYLDYKLLMGSSQI